MQDSYAEPMNKSARILVDRLAPSAQSGEPVEIYRMLGDLTLDVVGGCAFGEAHLIKSAAYHEI